MNQATKYIVVKVLSNERKNILILFNFFLWDFVEKMMKSDEFVQMQFIF